MMELDYATEPRMSDHAPKVVNLPLKDPCIGKSSPACTGDDAIPDQDPDFSDDADFVAADTDPL
jgi:hypothetical protein